MELSPADLFNYVAITDSAALTSRKGQLQKSVKVSYSYKLWDFCCCCLHIPIVLGNIARTWSGN